jgi:hypothetical protein
VVALAAAMRVRGAVAGPARALAREKTPTPMTASVPQHPAGPEDPLIRLVSECVQSPVVVSALVLGIAAGRMTKRSSRD